MGGQNSNAKAQQALGNNAAATSQGNANTFGGQQQGLFSTLFGSNGSGGNVGAMANPSSLNVNSPTGPYALMYNQAKAQGATNLQQANQNVDMNAGNAGFGAGAPSGYTGFLKSQNALQNAGNNGQLFSQFAGQSYQDALNNFWKANQMLGSQTATSGNQQNAAQGSTNSTYANLYGSTPKATTGQIIGQDLSGAVGAAAGPATAAIACVCEGTKIVMSDGRELPVEFVKVGDKVKAQGHGENEVLGIEIYENQLCMEIETQMGMHLWASATHTLARPHGGYVKMADADLQLIAAQKVAQFVSQIKGSDARRVYKLVLNGNHTFLSNGLWSLE